MDLQQQQQQMSALPPLNSQQMVQLVLSLVKQNQRETALLELSKRRESYVSDHWGAVTSGAIYPAPLWCRQNPQTCFENSPLEESLSPRMR